MWLLCPPELASDCSGTRTVSEQQTRTVGNGPSASTIGPVSGESDPANWNGIVAKTHLIHASSPLWEILDDLDGPKAGLRQQTQ